MTDSLPPIVKITDYPVSIGLMIGVVLTTILLIVSSRFDSTQGQLTISFMVVLAFIGAVAFCMIFTIPSDEATSALIGGLTAAFGAIIAYWLGRPKQ